MGYSKTIAGLIVLVLGFVGVSDLVINSDQVATVVNNIIEVVGIIITAYGRFTAKRPISLLGFRK